MQKTALQWFCKLIKDMDIIEHERRKYRLRARGTSFAKIAKELGIAQTNISAVSQGKRTSARIQKAIADALGESVESAFPEELN